jgi:hypothetical protein
MWSLVKAKKVSKYFHRIDKGMDETENFLMLGFL